MTEKKRSTFNLFIRSLIFSIYSVSTIMLYSFVCVLSLPFPLRYRHGLIRNYLRLYIYVLKKICHIDYQVEGLEHIPKDRNGIILSKHQSTWETFFLPIIFHDPAIILKRELLWLPFFGWGLAASDPIAINRSSKSNAMQQIIAKGKKCLDEGRWILVFPEGTRVPPGVVGNYKLGGARLAAATGYPVIPVAHNAGKFWPRRKFIKQPGTVRVVIGPLIESKGRTAEEILKLAKQWIEETVMRIG
ncbi:lysophospholipid acyltransferase family protein [Aquicella lusitana]|uniref:1-acyl-sn-glycerol-3-phosphate acyltransferase n=1 Tax=Aquicella lusitana TaxID=254246 RepID=A0A370G585_9COXI|nr:lysophospholipid acyltransferase family protein [Aquicella lusitana]RDI38380.1 1-acyl-sn-glycerol-3-phosphate acyltransferase [Aquicella lusitana]VVC72393.1 1-acyl-sn-glycerol-3-phosphate acyltransferase [Aquicella lusitana]